MAMKFTFFFLNMAKIHHYIPRRIEGGAGHNGRISRFLAPQDIPDFSGYQLGIGCHFDRACNSENPVPSQKIL